MSEPSLLATKFTIPPLRAHLLPRAALIERLNQSCALPLVLLSASAGFGKTTLLAAWASQCPHPVACLRSPQPPQLLTVLTALINDLATSGQEIVLILDDYHLIEEPSIHSSLQFLLDHTPSCLHLILSSRVDPPLSLSRLRDTDLRVSEQEGALFLRQMMGLHLSAEDELRLARRTEGWLVGLQLAALSLSRQADPSAWIAAFSGSQRFILDYVQEEILACQPLAVQRFLLQTAVLNRMHGALCQAVTGEPASQALLETLERANLFLVPLDEERRWYRWHDLFREAMLARLHTVQPEMVPVLHQRAAQWYEAQEEWHEAISHWLSASDFSSAARLMEQTAEQFSLRGEATTLSRWVMALPDAVVREHAPLVLTVALYLIGETTPTVDGQQTRAHQEAQQLMARVEMTLLHQENGTSLYVVALHQAGKTEQARAVAVRLLTLTEAEGYVRVYLDVGRPMQQTLQSILTAAPDTTERISALSRSALARLVAAFAHEEQMRAVRAAAPPARPQAVSPLLSPRLSGVAPSTPALLEPLTPQEQRVLQLLAEGASNQQIATQLVIQLVTVKKHLTNLLGKLGAANRTQALVRAREYGLLSLPSRSPFLLSTTCYQRYTLVYCVGV